LTDPGAVVHRDPFDRLLVAQARAFDIPIIRADPRIARYEVQTIW
jgi:PIN domain nuclease of toxin-antitoxin system